MVLAFGLEGEHHPKILIVTCYLLPMEHKATYTTRKKREEKE